MILDKPKVIIASGNSAGGKSTILKAMETVIDERGLKHVKVTDRQWLAAAIKQDVITNGFKEEALEEGKPVWLGRDSLVFIDETSKEAKNWSSFMEVDPEKLQFAVRNGNLLNRVHEQMRDMAVNWSQDGVLLMEWTVAPNIENFLLPTEGCVSVWQDGESVIKLFTELETGVQLPEIELIYITADYELRFKRNKSRPRRLDDEVLRQYFPDGGELTKEAVGDLLPGIAFRGYDNNYDDPKRFVDEMIDLSWELLESGGQHPERK
jgi:energy-coupling factor transporter ATP-binding protein EcfA2